MKNRYLLLITLIFGLATEVAQTSDSFKELKASTCWPTACKTVFNALPQDHVAAKSAAAVYAPPARLTQDKQLREFTYQSAHQYLMEYNIKPEYANWYLKTAENLILAEGQKYDPDFGSRFKSWCLGKNWIFSRCSGESIYGMRSACLEDIIKYKQLISIDKASFHHERGHDYLDHLTQQDILLNKMIQKDNVIPFYLAKNKKEFSLISNKKELLEDLIAFHFFLVELEKEADAFIPNDPTLLAANAKFFTGLAYYYPSAFSSTHPSDNYRAKYFRDKFKEVTKLQNEKEVDSLIERYTKDFEITASNKPMETNSIDLTDEYTLYCKLKPTVLNNVQFYEQ